MDLDRELRHRTRFHQRRANRVSYEIVDGRLLAEANFGLRGMHVDVDLGRRHLQEEQDDRKNRGRQDVAVSLGDRVLDQAIANQAAIYENENRVAVELLNFWFRNKAVEVKLSRRGWLLTFLELFASP